MGGTSHPIPSAASLQTSVWPEQPLPAAEVVGHRIPSTQEFASMQSIAQALRQESLLDQDLIPSDLAFSCLAFCSASSTSIFFTALQMHIPGLACLPPAGHPIIVGPTALLGAIDLFQLPDGEIFQPGPFRPATSTLRWSASFCSFKGYIAGQDASLLDAFASLASFRALFRSCFLFRRGRSNA